MDRLKRCDACDNPYTLDWHEVDGATLCWVCYRNLLGEQAEDACDPT